MDPYALVALGIVVVAVFVFKKRAGVWLAGLSPAARRAAGMAAALITAAAMASWFVTGNERIMPVAAVGTAAWLLLKRGGKGPKRM